MMKKDPPDKKTAEPVIYYDALNKITGERKLIRRDPLTTVMLCSSNFVILRVFREEGS